MVVNNLDERVLLRKIARGSQRALETAIRTYSAYVLTVVHNRSRGLLSFEDEEEVVSDVFYSLWINAGAIERGYMRSWLGSVARNRTADRLRSLKLSVPVEDFQIPVSDTQWETLSKKEQARQLRIALMSLKAEDREIFYRYYDLCQTTNEIAAEMELLPSTVRTRLSRGREALRKALCREGFEYEH